jgi:hypothetical protein
MRYLSVEVLFWPDFGRQIRMLGKILQWTLHMLQISFLIFGKGARGCHFSFEVGSVQVDCGWFGAGPETHRVPSYDLDTLSDALDNQIGLVWLL